MWTTPPLPCTINGIEITVESIDDTVARSVVEHLYPDRDGADLEDTGAEPRRISLTAHLRGTAWLSNLKGLEASLAESGADTLVHPQYGTLTGKVKQLAITHRDAEHDIARIRVEFVEGNVEPASFATTLSASSAAASVRSAGAEVTAAAAALE